MTQTQTQGEDTLQWIMKHLLLIRLMYTSPFIENENNPNISYLIDTFETNTLSEALEILHPKPVPIFSN